MNSVLLIDDDKELCALMKKCVEQENLSVITAHNGAEGLRLASENNCSLIILDVMLPDIDGFQVLRKSFNRFLIISLDVLICRYSPLLRAFPALFISEEPHKSFYYPLCFHSQK